MDAQNQSFNCKAHPKENLIYLKVNDFKNNDKILYCKTCIEEVDYFITQNFLSIKNILQPNHESVLKWPPLDNINVISQIKQIISASEKQKIQKIEKEIIQFFDQFKKQILEKINHQQKSMIQFASNVQNQNVNAIKQLISFSNIEILQSILKNTKIDCLEKENQLREAINQANFQKQQNLQQVTKIVKEMNKYNKQNKFEIPKDSYKSILTLLDQIQFFNNQNILSNIELKNRPFILNEQQYPKNLQIERLFDNSIELKCQKDDAQIFYSDLIFEQMKKYTFIFDVEAESFENQIINIGIIDDKIKHLNFDQYNKNQLIIISQIFEKNNKMIKFGQQNLIKIKGDWQVKEMKAIELRVDLQNQMVEILDYPNYFHQFIIHQSIKNQLTKNNYRLNLFLCGAITVRVKDAFLCQQFE